MRKRTILFACLLCVSGDVAAQTPPAKDDWRWPEKPVNLKVLEGFNGQRLSPIMRGFTRSLGVRCTYCHVGEEGKPLSTYDFASDANPNKDRARGMLRMLKSINEQLKAIPASGPKRVNMWCHTCHAGRPKPTTLEDELGEAYAKSGVEGAVARYRELRERYYGKGGYDFSEQSLNGLGRELLSKGDSAAAIAVFTMTTTDYPRSAASWFGLAEAYAAAGKPRIAAIYYGKALEIDPANENALNRLREVEAKQER
jgi:tetratricopeptide (TPR) repeat protein